MVLVYMGADHHFITRQIFLRKFLCDFQRQLRRDFSGLEGLDDVVTLTSAYLSNILLGIHHLPVLQTRVAVLVGSEDAALCFIAI